MNKSLNRFSKHRQFAGRQHGNAGLVIVVLLLGMLLGALLGAVGAGLLGGLAFRGGAPDERIHDVFSLQTDVQRLLAYGQQAPDGNAEAVDEFTFLHSSIASRISTLRSGGLSGTRKALSVEGENALSQVERSWGRVESDARGMLELLPQTLAAQESLADFYAQIPMLQARTDALIQSILESRADPRQIYLLSRQMLLVERISRSMSELTRGGLSGITAADRLLRDSMVLGRVFEAFRDGNADLNVPALTDAGQREQLLEILEIQGELHQHVERQQAASYDHSQVNEMRLALPLSIQPLLDDLAALRNALL